MKKIGRYTIRGLLGRGGMGKVYTVSIPEIEKTAALKVCDPSPGLVALIGLEEIHRSFVSEAQTIAMLRHPNIIDIWDMGEADGKPFFLMDYHPNNLGTVMGETYRVEMPSRIIPIDKAIHYSRQILSGLCRLHYAGILHRDIKPFNMLITDQDMVKICDFGLSKLRGETFDAPSNLKVGSPFYAAPEQEADPDKADCEADLFSVGVIVYRMLTGNLPYRSQGNRITPPSQLNPDLDEPWDHFILNALSTDPTQRIPTAENMLKQLKNLASAWDEKKERTCRIPEIENVPRQTITDNPAGKPSISLRHTPVKVAPHNARSFFKTDALWRPAVYTVNAFSNTDPLTVMDAATGLVWQQSGSRYPLTWQDAHGHIRQLNQNQFAGVRTWRMPTVHELMSILTGTSQGREWCLEPVFDTTQKWLWSADKKSFTAAWYASIDLGYVAWQDMQAYYYVRAVSNISNNKQ